MTAARKPLPATPDSREHVARIDTARRRSRTESAALMLDPNITQYHILEAFAKFAKRIELLEAALKARGIPIPASLPPRSATTPPRCALPWRNRAFADPGPTQ